MAESGITLIIKQTDYLNFILQGLNKNVKVISLDTKEGWFWRLLHLIFNGRTNTPSRFLSSYISQENINELKGVKTPKVLLMGPIDIRLGNIIYSLLPKGVKKYLWIWNEIGPTPKNELCLSNSEKDVNISTFNPADARRYGIRFVHQVYRFVDDLGIDKSIKNDCYWVGRPKGRLNLLEDIQKTLEGIGFTCNFKVISTESDVISYEENLNEIRQTRCLVDFYNSTNEGISLRVLEALFFQKKLITTNQNVRNYDFYNPQNIFIWGVDNTNSIEYFMTSPFVDCPKEIKINYDINTWVENNFLCPYN